MLDPCNPSITEGSRSVTQCFVDPGARIGRALGFGAVDAEVADGSVDAALVTAAFYSAPVGNWRSLRLFLPRQPNPFSNMLSPLLYPRPRV